MIATLVAALSLASSLALDVPYLPQTDALCGGAATAMVFRYWGDTHADVQEFAPLVDWRAGGIATNVLTDAVMARGWRTERLDGQLETLTARVREGYPVIVLLPDRGDRYHYVVVTGGGSDVIVVHDPAWGPSRTIRATSFERAWKAAGSWALLIQPPAVRTGDASDPAPKTLAESRSDATAVDACDARLNRALDEIRARGFDHAEAVLGDVLAQCPHAAGPLRELSGMRFAQRRWREAAALARDALNRDPRDAYALDVLGSSLFMQDDGVGALQAWNQIGKPRVDRVRIEGLHHTRYQTIAEVMAIQPNMLLTAELFERARRRLSELPDRAMTRLEVRPEADGFATVDVVVVEIAAVPRGLAAWAGEAAHTAASRELAVAVPGRTGEGDVWAATWRWWRNRPGVSVGFAAPRVNHVPGVWRLEGSWEWETYEEAPASRIAQSRAHGGLTVSDWLSDGVRYAVSAGLDAWSGGPKAASIGGALQRVAFKDRLSLAIDATEWAPLSGGAAFSSAGASATAWSSTNTRGWVLRGTMGVTRVSDAAPLALWPGAGEGQARAPLLRAHPLLTDGVVELTGSAAFGRTVAYGSAELQRWMDRPWLIRLGLAGFADTARASRQVVAGSAPMQVDVGGGVRIKIPGTPGMLRADLARGLHDGTHALTFGWLF